MIIADLSSRMAACIRFFGRESCRICPSGPRWYRCRGCRREMAGFSREFFLMMCRSRMMTALWVGAVLAPMLWSVPGVWAAEEPRAAGWQLRDGDRVVLLGGTFVEREGQFGCLETTLTAAFADRAVTFRNLGWSGDTVWAESRGIFDPPAAGYQRMVKLVEELQPTVILLNYGQNEAFAGPAGLEKFVQQYRQLATDLTAKHGARLVFALPPLVHRPEAAYAAVNASLVEYRQAIQRLGEEMGTVLDWDWPLDAPVPGGVSTDELYEGLHPTEAGYRAFAAALSHRLGVTPLNFEAPQIAALRKQIVEKNTLFFHRWRPQNVTYLFGFRKHEQGNNAVEIPQFDELTQQADAAIAKQRAALR